jgi:hypothetical protein
LKQQITGVDCASVPYVEAIQQADAEHQQTSPQQ